jgi:hypothetical protein
VDSLPEQHIDSIPNNQARKEALKKVARVSFHRFYHPHLSEQEIAKDAGFENTENMRTSLKRWGLVGLLPPEEKKPTENNHKDSHELNPKPGHGLATQLPDISNARVLFRDTINTLAHHLENLAYHKDVLWGGKFFATDEIPKEAEMLPISYVRDEMPSEEWKKLCSRLGEDPESSVVYEYTDAVWAKGASHFPRWEETFLITAVLMDQPLKAERLLRELHPEPDQAPREEIHKLMFGRPGKSEGLYASARKISRLIRGGDTKPGRNPVGIDSFSQAEILSIREQREKGVSDKEIRRKLDLTEEEFKEREKFLPSVLPTQYESKPGF